MLTGASPGWKAHSCYPYKDQRNGKYIVITFLPHQKHSPAPEASRALTISGSARWWMPTKRAPAPLTTSGNYLSIGAQQIAPEHVLLCDWERSTQNNTVVKTFCWEPYPAFRRISLHPFLSNSLLSGRVRNSVPSPKSEQLAYMWVAQQTSNLSPR